MYQSLMNQMAGGGVGAPPAARNIGQPAVPEARPDIDLPEYDAAHDANFHGILDPHDHVLRNALNQMTPEVRQVLLQKIKQLLAPKPAAPPQASIPTRGVL